MCIRDRPFVIANDAGPSQSHTPPCHIPCQHAPVPWPPLTGAPLPSAHLAYGVREKLATYAFAIEHPDGGPKARGFAVILGITAAHLDHLAEQLEARLS